MFWVTLHYCVLANVALEMAKLGWCHGLRRVSALRSSGIPTGASRADPTSAHNTESELIPISQSGTGG